MDEHRRYFNKEMENIIKYQIEDTELKNTLEEFNNRLDKAEEKMKKKSSWAFILVWETDNKQVNKYKEVFRQWVQSTQWT